MVKALFIDAETHWCVRTEVFGAYALGSVLNSGRVAQGEVEKRRKEACGARNEVGKQFYPEVPRICVDAGAYAYIIMMQTTPRHPLIKPRRAPIPAYPRIGVEVHVYAWIINPCPRAPTPRRAPRSLGVAFTFSSQAEHPCSDPRLDVLQEA
ncbi:hypothetical protein PIB30_079965 [Stylosanthes scabra]|uniref:Uncharacterized protein n=1 Tax=Stylosanthes scabra TaxID=79078 RepID=A0ABU6ZPY0_9FABA|nr:hypothetical protein [Stylosanthes scabra]